MRSTLIVLCAVLAVAVAMMVPFEDQQWQAYKEKFNKQYATEEEEFYRYTIYQKSLLRAARRQAQELPGGATFGATKFSDRTEEELKTLFMPSSMIPNYKPTTVATELPVPKIPVKPNPTNWNWFTQASPAVCTPVYNQGECGSCWAFSATETIESYWALAGNTLTQLSMEQIVDCDTTAFGCEGGWPYWAYDYVMTQGGIDSYTSYPYTAESGASGTCQFNSASVVAKLKGYVNVTGETGLYKAASTSGPVSVCVDASTWSDYTGGVLTTCTTTVDHCVQLVGYQSYGSAFPTAYWIVRNSWGSDWGVNGFIYIGIGQDLCLIGDYATIVTVA